MNGVEILNQTNVYETEYNYVLFIVLIVVGAIIGGICFAIEETDWLGGLAGVFAGAIIGLAIGGVACLATANETDKIDYVKYQVTVSDEVSLNEFMDKYKILDKDGKIYTVKERDEC